MTGKTIGIRAILVRVSVSTLACAVAGLVIFAVSSIVFRPALHAVGDAVAAVQTCTVMQSRPCTSLSLSVLAADTGLELPKGTKVLKGEAGRYFPREDRFVLDATISIPPGTVLSNVPGNVDVEDAGTTTHGRHLFQVSLLT